MGGVAVAVNQSKPRACYKRLETDREYRERLHEHNGGGSTLLRSQISTSHGLYLDAIGDQIFCPRRIVEDVS